MFAAVIIAGALYFVMSPKPVTSAPPKEVSQDIHESESKPESISESKLIDTPVPEASGVKDDNNALINELREKINQLLGTNPKIMDVKKRAFTVRVRAKDFNEELFTQLRGLTEGRISLEKSKARLVTFKLSEPVSDDAEIHECIEAFLKYFIKYGELNMIRDINAIRNELRKLLDSQAVTYGRGMFTVKVNSKDFNEDLFRELHRAAGSKFSYKLLEDDSDSYRVDFRLSKAVLDNAKPDEYIDSFLSQIKLEESAPVSNVESTRGENKKSKACATWIMLLVSLLAAGGIAESKLGVIRNMFRRNTPRNMQQAASHDTRQSQRDPAKELTQKIISSLQNNFAEFYSKSLEVCEAVDTEKAAWQNKIIQPVRNQSSFMLPEEFINEFAKKCKHSSLEVVTDKGFNLDVRDSKNFDIDNVFAGLVHPVSSLKAGSRNQYISESIITDEIKKRLGNKSDTYGYMRFIFNTNINNIYVMAVFSLDPNDINHEKGRYILLGKDILFMNNPDELKDMISSKIQYDNNFGILSFSLNSTGGLNDKSPVTDCLRKFISQFAN